MDPPFFSGYVLDPSKCQKLSINEKREIVWQLAKWPQCAPEKLQTWSRRDLLEILCAEMGKERKYTGLTKQKLIENIFKILSEKKSGRHAEDAAQCPPITEPQTPAKRPRKNDHPSRLTIEAKSLSPRDESEAPINTRFCLNVACRATLRQDDPFCKRCSCCICHMYDDNKDPSLWLFCSSEDLAQGDFCGLSCHLDCALKDERSGIAKNGQCSKLDGSYYCIHCGRVNSLLGCWKKQLIIAKDARRVDVLCQRVSISHKLLTATQKYQRLHEIVDEAMKMLEAEVGLILGPQNNGRGLVNRLSVGAEVQRLCTQAIEALDTMLSSAPSANVQFKQAKSNPSGFINFDDKSSSSLVVVLDYEDADTSLSEELIGCKVWYRKVDAIDYPAEPIGTLYKPNRRLLITDLVPCAEYIFKVVPFSERRELLNSEVSVTTDDLVDRKVTMTPAPEEASPMTNSSGLYNPFEGDESRNTGVYADLNKFPASYSGYAEKADGIDSEKSSDQIYSCKEKDQDETPGPSGSALDDEPNSTLNSDSHLDSTTNSAELNQLLDVPKSENASNAPSENERAIAPSLPVTPVKLEAGSAKSSISLLLENGLQKPEEEPRSLSKKRSGKCDELCKKDGPIEGDYEYCVKVIRWLECEGLIESNFRVKFLTWFSFRATLQERRVVSIYVDTMIDDPSSLAGQLVDTFCEAIHGKRLPPVPNGFCMRLWH